MEKKQIGKITHVFSKISVAVLELDDDISAGDTVFIEGPGPEGTHVAFEQKVESMQIDRKPVEKAGAGQSVGFKTEKPVKAGCVVYKEV